MFAGFQGGDSEGHMEIIVKTDIHGLNIISGQQLAEIGVNIRDVILSGHTPGLSFIHIGHGDDFGALNLAVFIDMSLTDLAHANNAQTNFGIGGHC
jgi:hypothetical protein